MATLLRLAPPCSKVVGHLVGLYPTRPLSPLWGGAMQRRFFFHKMLAYFNPSDRQLKVNDGVAPHYQIIYKGASLRYVKYSDAFMTGALGSFFLGMASKKLFPGTAIFSGNMLSLPSALFMMCLMSTWCMIIYLTARHYVHRIYYSEELDQYLFVIKGRYPLTQRMLLVYPGDASLSQGHGILHFLQPLIGDLYETKGGTRLLINRLRFSVPLYYSKLLDASV